MITSYGYGTLRLKEGPNQPGPIFSTIYIFFSYNIFINSLLPSGSPLHTPLIFYFRDSHLRPPFATHIRDHVSRPRFATHFHDSLSRLPLATRVRDSTRNSQSRHQLRLAIFCRDFRCATPPLTDGLCKHPSVIS